MIDGKMEQSQDKYSDLFERARELIQNTKNIFFWGGSLILVSTFKFDYLWGSLQGNI
jgi:hypothetical protein